MNKTGVVLSILPESPTDAVYSKDLEKIGLRQQAISKILSNLYKQRKVERVFHPIDSRGFYKYWRVV